MIKLKKILLVAGCVAAMCFTTGKIQAQGRGNFDPAQMKQNILDFYKDKMSVTNDDEWKVLEGSIGKVVDAAADVRAGQMSAMRAMFRGRNRGGNNGDNNNTTTTTTDTNNRRNRGGFGGTPSPEADDLQKAIDDKAPKDEVNTKLAKLREANAAKEAKLAAAQDDLKKLLTSRQEAIAVLYGLLK